jgi:hypothetical protein
MKSASVCLVFSLALCSLPQTLLACAVCGFGQDGTSGGFLSTTLLLSLTPILMFAGIGLYLKSLVEKKPTHEFKDH